MVEFAKSMSLSFPVLSKGFCSQESIGYVVEAFSSQDGMVFDMDSLHFGFMNYLTGPLTGPPGAAPVGKTPAGRQGHDADPARRDKRIW